MLCKQVKNIFHVLMHMNGKNTLNRSNSVVLNIVVTILVAYYILDNGTRYVCHNVTR